MSINITDLSGQPRSDQDLQESIDVLKSVFVNNRLDLPPMLTVMFPTILECLIELQGFRELVKKIKAKQAQS